MSCSRIPCLYKAEGLVGIMRTTAIAQVCALAFGGLLAWSVSGLAGDDSSALRQAVIDGAGPDWRALTLDDFVNVNCAGDTWSMTDGMIMPVPTFVLFFSCDTAVVGRGD